MIQIEGPPRQVVSRETLDRMTDAMTHRGPDDRGTYLSDGVGLGVRRLSVIDVESGHQPFSNEDRSVWAIQNGELYNHAALRRMLTDERHRFTSRCDTEVIPHLYERLGYAFVGELRGKFGIAVWDARRRRGVLARDRLGVKPLYYAQTDGTLVFGSELKSVLASGLIAPDLDYEAIDAYLTLGFVPGPSTPLAHVSKLPPGHCLVVEDQAVRVERYWQFPMPIQTGSVDPRECGERLLAELEQAVVLRLMSDVPLGAMLSGGLDSSLIVALMARNMTDPVKTFSIGFRGPGADNELADAREVALALGAEHHEIELSFAEQRVDLAELVWHMDEPLADLSSLGFLALSELAARHVTVALSGQGADELLGGYARHRHAAIAGAVRRIATPLTSVGVPIAAHGPRKLRRAARILGARDPAARQLALRTGFLDGARRDLVRGPLARLDGHAAERAIREHTHGIGDDPLCTALFLDAQLGLVDDMLHYFDRASMAHSLEVRVPFLDHHVVEFCATIPSHLKIHGRTTKHVLKNVARGLVPDRIIDKPKIGFFNSAVDSWFRAQASDAIPRYLLAPEARSAEILDPAALKRLVRAHASGNECGHGGALLAALMLEVWLSTYLPRAVAPRAPVRERIEVCR